MTLEEWQHNLLKYYFARTEDSEGPVTTLSVTPWDFARCVEQPLSEGVRLQQEFACAVRTKVREGRCILDVATDYEEWRRPYLPEQPSFLPYLIFSLLAAAEAPEEQESEQGYWASFENLARPCLVAFNNRDWLPELWHVLAKWLAKRPQAYRPLQLPAVGGLTICGYSVKLAFPHKRDAERLANVLRDANLPLGYPGVESILRAVRPVIAQFRPSFRESFRSFENHRNGHAREERPFWCAVIAAKRGVDEAADVLSHEGAVVEPFTSNLLLELDLDEVPCLILGLSGDFPEQLLGEMVVREMWESVDRWPNCLTFPENDPVRFLNDPPDHLVASDRRAIRERFVPLIRVGGRPLWRVARGEEVVASDRALVGEEIVDALIEYFGGQMCPYFEGEHWSLVENLELRQSGDFPPALKALSALATPLDAPAPTLFGGVGEGRGYAFLRLPGSLPKVRARGALKVTLRSGERSEPCTVLNKADGTWALPRDFVGNIPERQRCEVLATFEDRVDGLELVRTGRTHFELFDEPKGGDFKGLGTGDYWIESARSLRGRADGKLILRRRSSRL